MAIKYGPFCQICFDAHYRFASDVSDGETPCIDCGAPQATIFVDPFDQEEQEYPVGWESWGEREWDRFYGRSPVDPEHWSSEDRWAALFGVDA